MAGLIVAILTDKWYLRQIYTYAYFPLALAVWIAGALGRLPRVKPSTKGEGHERRYFYGSGWAVCLSQPLLGVLCKILPRTPPSDTPTPPPRPPILPFLSPLS